MRYYRGTTIEKFSFDLKSPKIRREKLILVKSEVETREHVVLKLVAYLIFYDPRLKVEVDAEMHYKPDLMIAGDHTPELWIDCGKVAIRKVESLADRLRHTRVVIVKETKRELEQFKKVVEKKVEHADRIEYLAFEPSFIASIANALQRGNEITLYEVMENVIGLAVNQEVFESALYR